MSIANEITRLANAKAKIKTALENKGVTVNDSAKIDTYGNLVNSIKNGENLDNTDIIEGGTDYVFNFSYVDELELTPDELILSKPDLEKSLLLKAGVNIQSYVPFESIRNAINLTADKIKEGEHILGITGTLKSGIDTSDADATPNDILIGKTAYVNGEKIEGSVMDISGLRAFDTIRSVEANNDSEIVKVTVEVLQPIMITLDSYDNTRLFDVEMYYSDLAQAIGLTPDKIKTGETILGITGN